MANLEGADFNATDDIYKQSEDIKLLKEELGDLLLHVIFQAEIANEENSFHLSDSIKHISDKLVSRHPHIFSNNKNELYKKENWELLISTMVRCFICLDYQKFLQKARAV